MMLVDRKQHAFLIKGLPINCNHHLAIWLREKKTHLSRYKWYEPDNKQFIAVIQEATLFFIFFFFWLANTSAVLILIIDAIDRGVLLV